VQVSTVECGLELKPQRANVVQNCIEVGVRGGWHYLV